MLHGLFTQLCFNSPQHAMWNSQGLGEIPNHQGFPPAIPSHLAL